MHSITPGSSTSGREMLVCIPCKHRSTHIATASKLHRDGLQSCYSFCQNGSNDARICMGSNYCSHISHVYALLLHRVEEIRGSDIGTRAGLFEVLKLGDEFFTFIVDCEDPKACTILLRGASKDVLNEVRPMAWRAPCLSFQHNSVRHPEIWYLALHRAYSDRIQQAGSCMT